MKIQSYLNKQYTIKPLTVTSDFSSCALKDALIQLKFTLLKNTPYLLCLNRAALFQIQNILEIIKTINIVSVDVDIDEDLVNDAWYVVDTDSKTIIYSAGP